MIKHLELFGTLQNLKICMNLDTGSYRSLMSKSLAHKIGLVYNMCNANELLRIANNDTITVLGYVSTKISFIKLPHREFNIDLHVVNVLSEEIIVRNSFFNKHDFCIDFRGCSVTIQREKTYFAANSEDPTPDQELIYKKYCNRIKHQEIDKLIAEYSKNMPKLGVIKPFEHEIKLIDNIPVCQKPYNVPVKLTGALNDEINRLSKDKVIRKSKSDYASPALIILKKDNTIRLIIGYVKHNYKTIKMNYRFPTNRDQMND